MGLEKELEELLLKVPCPKLRELFRHHLNECPFCNKSLKPILAMFSSLPPSDFVDFISCPVQSCRLLI